MASSSSAAVKPLPADEAVFAKLAVMTPLLMPYPIFKAVPMERGRIMEPFTNLPQATHVIFEFRTVAD